MFRGNTSDAGNIVLENPLTLMVIENNFEKNPPMSTYYLCTILHTYFCKELIAIIIIMIASSF